MSKLLVVRGPSGAGKSTVAKALHKRCSRPTLLIHEDKVRFMFNTWKQPDHTASKQLTTAMILSGIENNHDVIYEGISNIQTYGIYFDRILAAHKTNNYFFYLDVSWEETVKRHAMRPEKADFSVQDMKRWLGYATPTGYASETIIPETSSLTETVETIIETAHLAPVKSKPFHSRLPNLTGP